MVMGIIGWVLFGVLALVYLSFSRHMARRVEALAEYVEFLLQNRSVYEDHRRKYAAMLQETTARSPAITLRELALHAKHALDGMADSLHAQTALSNAMGRGHSCPN